jgi:hypothetical protein
VSQSHHFIEYAAQAPNITLLIVGLFLANFRGEIVRCTDGCLGAVIGMLKDSGDTEVTYLYLICLCHEDILSFQITVQNFAIVNMLDSQAHLHKPVENLVFSVHNFADFLLISDLCIQITSIRIVHDYTEALLIHK